MSLIILTKIMKHGRFKSVSAQLLMDTDAVLSGECSWVATGRGTLQLWLLFVTHLWSVGAEA